MKKKRHSEEQIIAIVKQCEAGRRVPELAAEAGGGSRSVVRPSVLGLEAGFEAEDDRRRHRGYGAVR
jgi:hypothetical protein